MPAVGTNLRPTLNANDSCWWAINFKWFYKCGLESANHKLMAWIEQSSVFVAKYFTKTKPPTLYIFLTKGSVSLPFLGDTSSRLGDEKKKQLKTTTARWDSPPPFGGTSRQWARGRLQVELRECSPVSLFQDFPDWKNQKRPKKKEQHKSPG